ncbi:MAG: tripartite tricarboxylate transporter permease [Rubripirellula sp.]
MVTTELQQALSQVFLDPSVWAIVLGASVYGIFLGAMPGLTATMGVALFVPITYWMEPIPALAAIVTMVASAIFAGDIPTTLLRVPGTPASAAYADDAYALAKNGEAYSALGTSLWFSVCGGVFGAILLMLVGRRLAMAASWFSVAEYFWLYLIGLSCAVVVGRHGVLRSATGLAMGLLLSTVGLSAVYGQARFTFGHPELFQGINFIPAMIGLFGFSEVLRNLSWGEAKQVLCGKTRPESKILRDALARFRRHPGSWCRSSLLGTFIGALPGAGADMAAWVCVSVSKRFSKTPEKYGQGSTEAIADACSANSSSLAAAWIPALVFGIPGDSVTAIVIGVLYMKNLQPGPEIFEQQGVLVYSLYFIFLLANLVMLPVGWLAIRLGRQVLRVPKFVLLPIITLFCIVGSYAVNGSRFDVLLMIGFGLLGLMCERYRISIGAIVLGLILGGPLEERFVQTLSGSQGSLIGFVDRPVSLALAMICCVIWLRVVRGVWKTRQGEIIS